MAINNNSPTFTYVGWTGASVIYDNKLYVILKGSTQDKYIYWDYDTPNKFITSMKLLEKKVGRFLIVYNDKGIYSLIPNDNILVSFDESNDAILKDKIYGIYEENEEFGNRFVSIEEDIRGIKNIVGSSDENDGTLINKVTKLEQTSEKISMSVEDLTKIYSDDKALSKLKEDLNYSIINLNKDLGTLSSEFSNYYKDDNISDIEKAAIDVMLSKIILSKAEVLKSVGDVALISDTHDLTRLNNCIEDLNVTHSKFVENINMVISDGVVVPSEKTIIINSFSSYNLKINELKNICNDIIFLGIGGIISEQLAQITMNSNEIKLSVNSVETNFTNELNSQKNKFQEDIDDVMDSLGSLEGNINSSFKDGIISNAEKISIKQSLQNLSIEKADVNSQYNTVYNNANLVGTAKTNLKSAYDTYVGRYTTLVDTINTILNKSGLVNDNDKQSLDIAFENYKSSIATYSQRVNEAVDSISKKTTNDLANETNEKISEIVVDLNGITQRVSSTESTTTTLTEKVNITVKDVKVYYAINTSSTVAPTTGWSTTPPTWVEGKFIWSKTTTTLINGDSATTNPVCITGAKGSTGATGTGVESITTEYYLSTSKTTQTGGSWVTTQPTWSTGKYLWTRSKIVYKNPTSTAYTSPICDSSWEATNIVNTNLVALQKRVDTAESKITDTAITNTVSKTFYTKTDIDEKGYQTSSQVASTVKQEADKLIIGFESSGGNNLIRNGCGDGGAKYWTNLTSITSWDSSVMPYKNSLSLSNSKSSYNSLYSYRFEVQPDTKYTVTFWGYTSSNFNGMDAYLLSSTSTLAELGESSTYFSKSTTVVSNIRTNGAWKQYTYEVTTPSSVRSAVLRFDNNGTDSGTAYIYVSGVYMVQGSAGRKSNGTLIHPQWVCHKSEIYEGNTLIDKDGVKVSQSNYNGYTQMKSDGFYVNNGSENVISVTSSGATFKGKVIIQSGSSVPSSTLSGTISSSQLNSTITSNISTALSTANSNKSVLDSNKNNWSNAYNRVAQWAYGAVSGSTTINGGLIQSNTILAKHIAAGEITAGHISSQTLTGVTIKNSSGTFVVNPSGSITIGSSSSYKTHITNTGIIFNDSSGGYYSQINGGKYCFTDSNGNNVGHVGRNLWTGTSTYLTALNSEYGGTAVIGARESSSSSTYTCNLVVSSTSQWIDSNYYYKGLNITNQYLSGVLYVRGSLTSSSSSLGRIYANSSNYLYLRGYERTYLCVNEGTGLYVQSNSSALNGSDIYLYSNMYCNNFSLYNANVSKSLLATSPYTRSLKDNSSIDMITYVPYSLTNGELRYTQRETMATYEEYDNGDSTGRYICYCELPIFMAENLELNYHINIGKISFGDYRITEKTQYYFILESEKEGFAFTYEVVGKQIEKPDNNAIVANVGFLESDKEEAAGMEYEMN